MSRQSLNTMVPSLSDKFKSSDSDIRVMALLDLDKELTRIMTTGVQSTVARPRAADRTLEVYADEVSEKVLTGLVLGLLADPNAEVKSAAVKCLASMSKKARPDFLRQIVVTITERIGEPGQKVDEENRDISCLALKSVVADMTTDVPNLADIAAVILERIRLNVSPTNANGQLASELLQILTDVYNRFPVVFAENAKLQDASVSNFRTVLSQPSLSIRKRAVPALAAFITVCPHQFKKLQEDMSKGFANGGDSAKAWVTAVAGLAKTPASADVGALISSGGLVNEILKQTEDLDDADAVEGALSALETLALRCPTEMAPLVGTVTSSALELIKYDPNYVEFTDDEDNEDVDMDEYEDDDDEFDNDAYSDDDDESWKIRRSAAKLIAALISTRIDLLVDFYKTAAPVLVTRFSEREESVRLEVLAAFEALLKQTAIARAADLAASGRNKRKRGDQEDMDQDGDDSSITYLHEMRPQLVKAILKQAGAKTINTRQESFVLLRQIVEALDGGLESEADAICTASYGALRSSDSSSASLTIAVLSFLTPFFTHHVARTYASHLADLTQVVVRCMRDKLQRVNFEAFETASALAQAIRPVNNRGSNSPLRSGFDEPVREIFKVTTSVLGDSSVDGDIREKALATLGDVLVHEGDVVGKELPAALDLISARLGSENTAATAVDVIGRVAESTLCSGPAFDAWLLRVLSEVVIAIRRNKRSTTKTAEFTTLKSILNRVGNALPADIASGIIVELKGYVSTPAALQVISLVLANQPACRPQVDQHVLPEVLLAIKTLSNTTFIDALTDFFGTYVDGDIDCALGLVPTLVNNVVKANTLHDAAHGGTLAYTTTARSIGAVVLHSQRNLTGVLVTFERVIKSKKASEAETYLALMSIGEIGRFADLSPNTGLLQNVFDFFASDSEEVRSAASFAAGNMTVGAPEEYLPILVRKIEEAKDESSRLLLLYSLKEVILHSSTGQLELFTDILWRPLFGDGVASTTTAAIGDDGVRNVKAACIGKLTIAAPARFLPQLQEMLSSTPQQRALVAAAIRYTFIDASSSYTELIAPIVGEFLSLMKDENLVVRRLAVASLNAAAQNKPQLIFDKLPTLQPYLYKETEIKKELQREVQMGPWKVIEDDGLENRKTAYETMYTLLATCFSKLDLPAFTERVMAALRDVNEIKSLGLMLLHRLAQLAPAAVIPRLDETVEPLKAIMKDLEVKEDTIKQDLERKEEMQRSTLRTVVPLYGMSTQAQAPAFHALVVSLLRMEQWKEYRDYHA